MPCYTAAAAHWLYLLSSTVISITMRMQSQNVPRCDMMEIISLLSVIMHPLRWRAGAAAASRCRCAGDT
eukprot:6211223-Pleurochrysis_carterae.AAC.2